MKTANYIISFLVIAILFGCVDETIIQSNGEIEISASFSSSRTAYSSENGTTHVSWVEGDAIGIFTNKQENLKYLADQSGAKSTFTASKEKLELNENDSVFAYYPFTPDANGSGVSLTNLTDQEHNDHFSKNDFMYAYGKVKNNKLELRFQHLYAFLKITIPTKWLQPITYKDETVYGITVYNRKDVQIVPSDNIYDYYKKDIEGKSMYYTSYYIPKDVLPEEKVTCYIAILPQKPNTVLRIYNTPNPFYDSSKILYTKCVPAEGFVAGNVYTLNITEEKLANDYESNRLALIDLYNATNGDEWKNNTNWCSDKSIYEWYGVNNRSLSKEPLSENGIVELFLQGNNLKGTLPSSFAHFMDDAEDINIRYNGLYGKIPSEILNHPRWNELGWYIILQDPFLGGGFDFSMGTNLKLDDDKTYLYVRDSTKTIYEILNRNEVTMAFFAGVPDMLEGISDKKVNLYLDYCNKGLGMVGFAENSSSSSEKFIEYVKEKQEMGLPEGILWTEHSFVPSSRNLGDIYLFDRKGNLIAYWFCNGCIDESWYISKVDSVLRCYLGEPEEHPIFTSKYYTSTDYSRDGEVVTLQKATIGKGIDLVFLGDGFVDKDMNSGGLYERTMKQLMEELFAYEPYKSLRNRFNVYTIKAVSATTIYDEQKPDDKVFWQKTDSYIFDYATKVPNINEEQLHVALVVSPNAEYGRSSCAMYSDGSFIALLYESENTLFETENTVNHEIGGHGFANLLDEYVEPCYENLTLSEEKQISMDNVWNNFGWGANVDWRNDVSTVKWSHFLNDSRYANEGLGLYEGAYLYGHGAYRPTENSMMRYCDSPFNAPSREQIYKRIMQLSEGDDWKYDYEEFVKFDENSRNAASRSAVKQKTEAERKEYLKNHRPPRFIKGTWRDAMKKGKTQIVVPFR